MSILVINKRKGAKAPPAGAHIIYIGRPSVLGNPFPMQNESERPGVISRYEIWLRDEWKKGGAVRRELEALAKRVRDGEVLALQCWCAPKPCHGDVIRRAIEGINKRFYEQLALAQSATPG